MRNDWKGFSINLRDKKTWEGKKNQESSDAIGLPQQKMDRGA